MCNGEAHYLSKKIVFFFQETYKGCLDRKPICPSQLPLKRQIFRVLSCDLTKEKMKRAKHISAEILQKQFGVTCEC